MFDEHLDKQLTNLLTSGTWWIALLNKIINHPTKKLFKYLELQNKAASRPTYQRINEPTKEPTNRRIKQPTDQPKEQTSKQSTNQPNNYVTDQPTDQLRNSR